MALEIEVGSFAAPTTVTTTTVNLTRVTDLKAIVLWTGSHTADGSVDGDLMWGHGFVDKDGGTIHQCYFSFFSDDNVAAERPAQGINTTACIKTLNSSTPTIDGIASCTTFSATQFVLSWSDAPATAVMVHYMAIGGSDVTAARTFTFATTAAAATQNVTVVTGFGQPDLLLLSPSVNTALGEAGAQNCNAALCVSVDATNRRTAVHDEPTAAATMDVGAWHGAAALVTMQSAASPALDSVADLSTKASWPTDGFQLSYSDQAARANQVAGLALKGTFTVTLGAGNAPITGTPAVVQNLTHSTTPVGALFWGMPIASGAGLITTSTDLGGFWMGATDGTAEGSAGLTQRDTDAAGAAGRWESSAKAVREYTPTTGSGVPGLQSEADASISGSNVVLSWNDIDTIAREYQYVLLGSASAGPPAPTVPVIMAPYTPTY